MPQHVNPAHPHIPIFHHAMLFLPKHSFHRFITLYSEDGFDDGELRHLITGIVNTP